MPALPPLSAYNYGLDKRHAYMIPHSNLRYSNAAGPRVLILCAVRRPFCSRSHVNCSLTRVLDTCCRSTRREDHIATLKALGTALPGVPTFHPCFPDSTPCMHTPHTAHHILSAQSTLQVTARFSGLRLSGPSIIPTAGHHALHAKPRFVHD